MYACQNVKMPLAFRELQGKRNNLLNEENQNVRTKLQMRDMR
jgi:hypothetical protein